LLRLSVPRPASLAAAFVLLGTLVACGPPAMVPASRGPSQPPFPGASAPTPQPPPAAAGPIKVALLLPLSGPNAELGKGMLEAAQLALFNVGGDRLTLVPRDTAGTPDGATNAARAAIGEGVKLIVGPLLATEVEAVKPVARDAHIQIIAFSTATQLAGGNVFLVGFLPRQEISREVGFARERGLRRFALLAPNNAYGHLIGDSLRDAAGNTGGTVVKTEYFDAAAPDPAAAVNHFLGGGPPPGAEAHGTPPAPRSPDFEALLLPEGGDLLKGLARSVRQAGLAPDEVHLLGSGLWDDTSIGGEPALYGGWFAGSPPEPRHDFESRYQATYGHPAPRLASLAYDGAALAAALAARGGDEPFSREAILNPSGFSGADGLFRFTPEGLVQRALAVLEVTPQGTTVISPAQRSFRAPGA